MFATVMLGRATGLAIAAALTALLAAVTSFARPARQRRGLARSRRIKSSLPVLRAGRLRGLEQANLQTL